MFPERIYPLDAETLALFAAKGLETAGVAMTGNANGVKVRRIMQTVRDVAGTGDQPLRILDLACGEGVYAIEAALRGAQVVAIDGRTERMDKGRAAAERAGLQNLDFQRPKRTGSLTPFCFSAYSTISMPAIFSP